MTVLFNSVRAAAAAASLHPAAVAARAPTFADDVAPIIYQHCSGCHQEGGSGPFSLMGYEEVRSRSRQIAEVVADRYMPPWKPDSEYGPPLRGARRLSAEEIELIQEWRLHGMPPGDLDRAPAPPLNETDWALGEPDLVLELGEPYRLAADGFDVFRNFVFPNPLAEARHVRALEFRPRSALAIHHASIMTDDTGRARLRDEEDEELGFPSMDLGDFGNPDGQIIGWTPGQVPYETYPGTAWKLGPGADLVVQLHLLPSGKEQPVSPRIGLYFTDEEPTRTAAVIQLRELEIDIAPGDPDYRVEESIELPAPASVLRIFPHAHYLGKRIEIYATLPDGGKQELLLIPDWDFNWQSDYTFEKPVELPQGSRLVMRYRYDNSGDNVRNPSAPPERVKWGWRSTDEMGGAVIQLLLEDAVDLPSIHEAQARYDLSVLGRQPSLLLSLADALEQQARVPEALAVYAELLEADPESGTALRRAASLRLKQGSQVEAGRLLHRYLELYPRNKEARLALAAIHVALGSERLSVRTLQDGLEWFGDDLEYRLGLGNAYLEVGDSRSALAQFEAAARCPSDDRATLGAIWYKIAYLKLEAGDAASAQSAVDQAVEQSPGHAGARILGAYLALQESDEERAKLHLRALYSGPPERRPDAQAALDRLPVPAGPRLLAQVFAERGERSAAVELLKRSAAAARSRGDESSAAELERLAAQL